MTGIVGQRRYTIYSKLSSGKAFTVGLQNGHSWENFCGCILVDYILILILPVDKAINYNRVTLNNSQEHTCS